MPTPLAQELLDIIIGHVHDKPTLKSCALASSRFHTLSQRSLFSSLRISVASPISATGRIRDNLDGGVPVCLVRGGERQRLPFSVGSAQTRSLLHLGNSFYPSWATPFSAPILDFIQHQNLVELHIRCITCIPPATLAAFFCATQTLGLHEVVVDLTLEDLSAAFPDVKVEYLRISNSDTALDNLRCRQFAPLAANVRRLWITEDSRYATFEFTPEMAGRLEHLRVEWPLLRYYPGTSIDPTEPLVALRTLDWSLNRDVDPLSVAILKPLFSCTTAALVEIRFSYTLGKKIIRKCYFHAGTLEAVAAALEKCPGTPRISWYLNVEGGSARKERELVKFTALLQAGLPHIHKQGRLYVQNCARDDWSP